MQTFVHLNMHYMLKDVINYFPELSLVRKMYAIEWAIHYMGTIEWARYYIILDVNSHHPA